MGSLRSTIFALYQNLRKINILFQYKKFKGVQHEHLLAI